MTSPAHWEPFCRERGLSTELTLAGVGGLVRRWRRTASEIERTYRGDLDEYLNEMDTRQILADFRLYEMSNGFHAFRPREFEVDAELRPHLVDARGCLWGEANAAKHGWTPEANWWYFSHPGRMGDALREDLARRNLLNDA